MSAKVFGIGFHKTATTSLYFALTELGYDVCGAQGVHDPDIATRIDATIEAHVPKHDAFVDNPWPIVFRELDARYPGSKFILTVRPVERWLASVQKHFGTADTPMREWIYGAGHGHPVGHEDVYAERYERHNREVEAYFAERPGDLLVLRVSEGEGWEKLCPFLGTDIPDAEFPHANKMTAMRRLKLRIKGVLGAG